MDQPSAAERVPASAISGLIEDALVAVGLPAADAAKVAELMTEADLTGADAHGVFRLPQYVRRLRAGGVNPRPDIRVDRTAPATALVDGDNGMGHLVMARAAETAVELARASRRRLGRRAAHRTMPARPASMPAMPLAHGMIGIYSVVASANHMALWGGAETLLGTNPLAFAIPAGAEAPVVLDIATTVVSYGTVKAYALQGSEMPEGWMVEPRGRPAAHRSARSAEGLLLPIGGYKGSGLALVLGLLAGTLNGAAFGRDVIDFNYDDDERLQHRPFHRRARRRALRAARRRSRPRSTATCATCGVRKRCPASMRSACRASSAGTARRIGARNGVPIVPPVVGSSTSWRTIEHHVPLRMARRAAAHRATHSAASWVPACAGMTPRMCRGRLSHASLLLHRGAHARDRLGRRARDLLDQRGDLLAGERIDVDLELLGLGEIGRILHGGVERAPQRVDAVGRHVRRQEERPAVFEPRQRQQHRLLGRHRSWRGRAPAARLGSSGCFRSAHCARILIFFSLIQLRLIAFSVDQFAKVPCTSPRSIARWILGVPS